MGFAAAQPILRAASSDQVEGQAGLVGIGVAALVPSRGFETNRFADVPGLPATRLQLRLHEFCLNSNDVTEILGMAQFLNEFVRHSEILLRRTFEFFTPFRAARRIGRNYLLNESEIVIHRRTGLLHGLLDDELSLRVHVCQGWFDLPYHHSLQALGFSRMSAASAAQFGNYRAQTSRRSMRSGDGRGAHLHPTYRHCLSRKGVSLSQKIRPSATFPKLKTSRRHHYAAHALSQRHVGLRTEGSALPRREATRLRGQTSQPPRRRPEAAGIPCAQSERLRADTGAR